MKLKFAYKKIISSDPKQGIFLRPIIPIELENKGQNVRYEALVDSGADMNMFPWELAEILGLDKKDAKEVRTFSGVVGKPAKAYYFDILLVVGGSDRNIVLCGFTDGISRYGHGFLGQSGFFSLYRVEFDYAKETIKIWSGPKT